MSIVFGEVIVCGDCGGTGETGPLSDVEKREREKELRQYRKRGEPAPPLVHSQCKTCRGGGVLREKGKYR